MQMEGNFQLAIQEAWNNWQNVKVGLKSFINDRHSSVIMNPFPSITRLMWLFKFIKNIKNNEKITYDICQMAIKSIKLYDSMAKKEKPKI